MEMGVCGASIRVTPSLLKREPFGKHVERLSLFVVTRLVVLSDHFNNTRVRISRRGFLETVRRCTASWANSICIS
jgi:hypothetical protein